MIFCFCGVDLLFPMHSCMQQHAAVKKSLDTFFLKGKFCNDIGLEQQYTLRLFRNGQIET